MSSCNLILHNKDTQSIKVHNLKQYLRDTNCNDFPEELDTAELTDHLIKSLGGGKMYLYGIPGVVPRTEMTTVQLLDVPITFSYYPRGEAPKTESDITVKVITATGQRTLINIPPNATVKELKHRIEREQGTPAENQRLFHMMREQCLNDRTLSECGIRQNALINLQMTELRGGIADRFNFVDVCKEKIKKIQWSDEAPKWRIAKHGLCFEGLCPNKKCEAHKKWVVMNMGDDIHFDLRNTLQLEAFCRCPICKETVQPTTVGYNNCQLKYKGSKLEKSNGKSKYVMKESQWFVAGDEYHRFEDDDKKGCSSWVSLVFSVKPCNVNLGEEMCSICLEDLNEEQHTVLAHCCNKPFHHKCLQTWTKVVPSCPNCRHEFEKRDKRKLEQCKTKAKIADPDPKQVVNETMNTNEVPA